LRKKKENVVLCSKVRLLNGSCVINILKDFYVDLDDARFSLLLYLFLGNEKRYAGEVELNVLEWEENVIHSTESKISNSPDKNSRIKY
jgi:hypothetical protein